MRQQLVAQTRAQAIAALRNLLQFYRNRPTHARSKLTVQLSFELGVRGGEVH